MFIMINGRFSSLMSDCVGSLGGKGAHCSESLFFVEVLYKFKPNVIKFTFLYMFNSQLL